MSVRSQRPPPNILVLSAMGKLNFTMGPNGHNQHFAELRQEVCSSIHDSVLQRGLRSLDGKIERFVSKKMKKAVAELKSDRLFSNGDFRQT